MNNVKKSKRIILPLFIVIISLFMGIGYATVNGIVLDLSGVANAIVLEEIYISDIDNPDNIIINNYEKTLLNSKVVLDDTDIESAKSIDITLSNNTKSHQFFEEIRYQLGNITYDNSHIEFTLDERLTEGYELQPKESVTFTLTFKYTEAYKQEVLINHPDKLDNELNSILNFYFGYLIKFYQGKGNIKPDNYYLQSNSTYLTEITKEIPTREGYIFMGWYDNQDYQQGQMFYNEEETPTRLNDLILNSYEIKLYPGWQPIEYTITYHYSLLPGDYQEVEYLETLNGNYILTDIVPTDDMKIDFTWYTEGTSSNYILGSRTNSSSTIYISQSGSMSNQSILGSFNGISLAAKTGSTNWTRTKTGAWYHTILSTDNGLGYYYIKDITNNREYSNSTTYPLLGKVTAPIGIFGYNSGNIVNGKSRVKQIDFYKYSTNELIHSLIPCYRIKDNKVGLYDTINEKFYTNATTGNLTTGQNIYDSSTYIDHLKYDENNTIKDFNFSDNYYIEKWHDYGSDKSYSPNESIINLTTTNNDNIDLYSDIKKYIFIRFKIDGSTLYKEVKFKHNQTIDIKDLVLNIPNKIFTGWYDEFGNQYYDQLGNYNNKPIKEDLWLYAKFLLQYQKLEYIETINNSYILTDIIPTDDMIIDFTWYTEGTDSNYILGSRVNSNSTIIVSQSGSRSNQTIIASFNGISLTAQTDSKNWARTKAGAWYHSIISMNSGVGYYYIKDITNDLEYRDSTTYPLIGTTSAPIGIFGFNSGNIVSGKSRMKTIKIYKYTTNELLADLVPCIYSNSVGLCDSLSDKFYQNKGTNQLISGPEIIE